MVSAVSVLSHAAQAPSRARPRPLSEARCADRIGRVEPSSPPQQTAPEWGADVDLARRARSGNADAVDELLRRMACVRRFHVHKNEQLGRPLEVHELEDVIQETLFALWQKLDEYRGSGPLEAWAYRFAYVRLVGRVRKLDRRPRLIDDVREAVPEPLAEPLEDAYRYEVLYLTLERVGARDRDLIRMKVFDQRTFEDLAVLLELPVGTVKTRFYRALARLRALLETSGEAPVPVPGERP
jgi:RNA polymerase sigma-70 factor (ECF subfamily)